MTERVRQERAELGEEPKLGGIADGISGGKDAKGKIKAERRGEDRERVERDSRDEPSLDSTDVRV